MRTGTFVNDDQGFFQAFSDTGAAIALTKELMQNGADVVFPSTDRPGRPDPARPPEARTVLIGVDTDQHYATPDCAGQWLTSALKSTARWSMSPWNR